MSSSEENSFVKLSAINVNSHTEKKGSLTYLSWPFAVSELLKADPLANWMWGEPVKYGDTMMVTCTVTAFGIARTIHLPVMDNRNKAISNPDAFSVNTAQMRCLVKAIATHGLGLYIYAGEDLPIADEPAKVEASRPASVAKVEFSSLPIEEQEFLKNMAMDVLSCEDDEAMFNAYMKAKATLDSDENIAFWSLFDSKQRSIIKRIGLDMQKNSQQQGAINE